MNTNDSGYQYYSRGGSLPKDARTYVTREADRLFYEGLKSGEFCYVLNSRQMGKSSLRVRAMHRLQAEGAACAVIDLTQIGSTETDTVQWYAGIITTIADSMNIPDFDLNEWWQSCGMISPVQHLSKFFGEVLLKKIASRVVIFIDETDAIKRFGEDFFALVRSVYEKRPDNPEFNRLTFGILGVASPGDLIKDKKCTPFNIGIPVPLNGFQLHEAGPLAAGLQDMADSPESVLKEILAWTGGQPFLTQKVCDLICKATSRIPAGNEPGLVEQTVRTQIIENWESKDEPPHLKPIRDRILQEGGQRTSRLLGLYEQILNAGELPADDSPEQAELLLSGLVVKQENMLRVYNRIYAQVFDAPWAKNELESLRPYSESLKAWDASGCTDESRLLSGQALKDAQEWAAGRSLSDQDHRFLAASRESEQKAVEHALKIELQESQLLAQKRRNRLLAGFLAVALFLGGISVWQWFRAENQREIAVNAFEQSEQQKEIAVNAFERADQQKELALQAVNILTYDLVDELSDIPRTGNILTRILTSNVKVLDRIYDLEPDTRKAMREKGSNLNRLGNCWLKLGNTAEAVKAYQTFNEISKQLAAADPDSVEAQRDLSVSYNNLGDVFMQTGRTDEAVKAYQQAMEIRKQLAAADPDSAAARRDLSVSFEKLGDVFMQTGRTDEAVKAYQQAMEIRKQLAAEDPDSAAAQRDLSVSFERLGDVYRKTGRTDEAVKAYQQAMEIRKQLAAEDPDSAAAQRDLSVSFERLGDVFMQTGRTDEAVKAYQQAMEIRKQLAAEDPDSAAARRDLAFSYNRLGRVYEISDNPKAALQAQQQGLSIAQALAAEDSQNKYIQDDIAEYAGVIARLQGDEHIRQNNPSAALKSYQKALEMSRQLTQENPSNWDVRRDLYFNHRKVGEAFEALKDPKAALQAYQAALAIVQELAAKDTHNQQAQKQLEWLLNKVEELTN